MAVAIAVVGCTKDDTSLDPSLPYESSERAISFDSVAKAKGYICDDAINPLDTMEINAYYTKQSIWCDATDIDQFMSQQFISKKGTSWIYSPIKYWSNNDNDKISFFSTSPYNEIRCENDETTGKPSFRYEANPFAEYNDDLLMGVVLNAEKSDAGVTFAMEHLLTRINIEVAVINASEVVDEYDVTYAVNGVVFNDVLLGGEVIVDQTDGSLSWDVDESSALYIAATQGKTLMAYEDAELKTTPANTAPDEYIFNSVCKKNSDGKPVHAIFVMPQPIESSTITEPTVELRIRKRYTYYSAVYDEDSALSTTPNENGEYPYRGEVIYVPKAIALPTPGKGGWKKGENITMRFIFDLSADNPMPLTVLSMIYEYSDVDIDINVNRNVYIYSDKNDTIYLNEGDTEAKMNFYTNYIHDLTTDHEHTELDGSVTTSHGFVFYNGSYESSKGSPWYPEKTEETVDGYAKYKVTSSANKDHIFYYLLKKSTRKAEGCYIGEDGTGINKGKDDDVYMLRLIIDNSHLTACDKDGTLNENGDYGTFSGDIAVEMLSNAGGLITKLFPIRVIKK